jgi:hypothetical protein
LYNRLADGSPVIRKFSMSGAGAFADPGEENAAGDDEDDVPDDEELDELDHTPRDVVS